MLGPLLDPKHWNIQKKKINFESTFEFVDLDEDFKTHLRVPGTFKNSKCNPKGGLNLNSNRKIMFFRAVDTLENQIHFLSPKTIKIDSKNFETHQL